MTDDDVVEAMARAICNAERLDAGWPFVSDEEWHEVEGYDRYTRLARAAIRACHAAGGLVVGKMPGAISIPNTVDVPKNLTAGQIAHIGAVGHNAALAAVRSAAVEVE